MKDLSLEIGSRLKSLRIGKGLTQKKLAAKVSDGVDYTYIGKIERGQQLPSLKVLQRISETLSVPVSYFFTGETDTVVHVNCSAELLKVEKERELSSALRGLERRDIPLVIEIIRTLSRHRKAALDKMPVEPELHAEEILTRGSRSDFLIKE